MLVLVVVVVVLLLLLLITAIQLMAVCCVDMKGVNYGRHVGCYRGS